MSSGFSRRWFASFLGDEREDGAGANDASTTTPLARREVEALARWLPVEEFPRLLDLCCGLGRHLAELQRAGYEVSGLDGSPEALAVAAGRAPGARLFCADQRELANVAPGPFDAIVAFWQSFGFFDAAGNDAALRSIAAALRPGGRLVLDLFRAGAVAEAAGPQPPRPNGAQSVIEALGGGFWRDTITYPDGTVEALTWELFEPDGLIRRARAQGLHEVALATEWRAAPAAAAEATRFQLILERRSPT